MTRVLLVVFLLFLCLTPPASASPSLLTADPGTNSTISVAPRDVRLTFDRTIAGAGPYSIAVTGGGEQWSEPMIGADDTVLTVPLRPAMPAGDYLVSYELTPPDGVQVKGEYRFSLQGRAATPWWVWLVVGATVVGVAATAYRLAHR
ncbi:copper resistance CopC family protein [Lentzea californiensis]|uniref:copper resistance CopC family protein n=1 Tax=Lentzea californiensis TaxID=438851 RepID=UPI0021665C97|nr:copper resistance CopC family protein [Lentzea californiensis]MCR3750100.1 Copper-binding protein CopC (methionine-rich) [Lentzea californiensis]